MNWSEIVALLNQYSGLGLGLVGVAFVTSKHWMPYVAKLKLPFVTNNDDGTDPAEDVKDVEALHRLQKRGKRNKCAEYCAGLREVERNFFATKAPVTPPPVEAKV